MAVLGSRIRGARGTGRRRRSARARRRARARESTRSRTGLGRPSIAGARGSATGVAAGLRAPAAPRRARRDQRRWRARSGSARCPAAGRPSRRSSSSRSSASRIAHVLQVAAAARSCELQARLGRLRLRVGWPRAGSVARRRVSSSLQQRRPARSAARRTDDDQRRRRPGDAEDVDSRSDSRRTSRGSWPAPCGVGRRPGRRWLRSSRHGRSPPGASGSLTRQQRPRLAAARTKQAQPEPADGRPAPRRSSQWTAAIARASNAGAISQNRSTQRMTSISSGDDRQAPARCASGRARAAGRTAATKWKQHQRERDPLPAAVRCGAGTTAISSGRLPDQMIRNCENAK